MIKLPPLVLSRRNVLFGLVVLAPLLLNLAVWKFFFDPAFGKLSALQEAESIEKMKPQWTALLQQSGDLLQRSSYNRETAAVVVKEIQKQAGICGVQIDEILKKNLEGGGSSLVIMPVEAKVAGSYKKLTQWIGAIENIPGLQVDSWTFVKPEDSGRDRLDIHIRVILRTP